MREILQQLTVRHEYRVVFTRAAFAPDNPVLAETLLPAVGGQPARALLVLDDGLLHADPGLPRRAADYAAAHGGELRWAGPPLVLPGGERCKADRAALELTLDAVAAAGLCRHSYLIAVGGGAVLDVAGFAAATAHRGVRLVRLPSTVLAQNDAGVGVKNGINAFGRKNYLGSFAPPFAVINDSELLRTLGLRDRRAGLAEAVKVASIRDAAFFAWLEEQQGALARGEAAALEESVFRCAALHLAHIAQGGDPFEQGSARPLDFGHWAAHRLEEVTQGELRHGEAVAIGIALDSLYARGAGLLTTGDLERIVALLGGLGLPLWHPALLQLDLQAALGSFREHLGGELTITLPFGLGRRVEVHGMDPGRLRAAAGELAWRGGHRPGRTGGDVDDRDCMPSLRAGGAR